MKWGRNRHSGLGLKGEMMVASDLLCLADRHSEAFDRQRSAVDVVCAGDSITGWNKFGPVAYLPHGNESMFPPRIVEELQGKRSPHGM
jgi:hypothetical protein